MVENLFVVISCISSNISMFVAKIAPCKRRMKNVYHMAS